MGGSEVVAMMDQVVAKHEVLFAAIGGDVAYVDAFITCYRRWDWWLDQWEAAVTPLGYSVPVIMAIGNHEAGGFSLSKTDVPYFLKYFVHEPFQSDPLELNTYHSHIIGDNTILVSLDSGIVSDPGGEQSTWLEEQLITNVNKTNKYALYHVPLYPSIRPYSDKQSTAARKAWQPIFDTYGLTIGFENHDHGYKRTFPLKNNTENSNGTLYMGDGAWGVKRTGQTPRPYIAKSMSEWFILVVQSTANATYIDARNEDDVVIDSAIQYPLVSN